MCLAIQKIDTSKNEVGMQYDNHPFANDDAPNVFALTFYWWQTVKGFVIPIELEMRISLAFLLIIKHTF